MEIALKTGPVPRIAPRVLVVTMAYSVDGTRPWLLDDLVLGLAGQGAEVDVIVADTKQVRPRGAAPSTDERIRVWSVGPTSQRSTAFGKLISYGGAAFRLHTSGYRLVKKEKYDLCIFTSIAAVTAGFPARVRRAGIARRLVFVLWDFFPIHQIEIGRITRGPLTALLKVLERLAIGNADFIATMTPRGTAFLNAYHRGLRGSTIEIRPWSSPSPGSSAPSQRNAVFTVVFGGQLVAGRGVSTLLDAAGLLQNWGIPAQIEIYGSGADRVVLESRAQAEGLKIVHFQDLLSREEYRTVLARAHLGIAVTVPDVSVPSYPSKIVDYCLAGLPVIACVEAATDAGTLVEEAGVGLATPAGDGQRLAEAIRTMYSEFRIGSWAARSVAAREYFNTDLATEVAARRFLALTQAVTVADEGQ